MNTPRFSSTFRSRSRLISTLLAAMVAAQLDAATVFKDNNSASLNDASSWVGGILPTANDIITWDDRVALVSGDFVSHSMGGAVNVAGVKMLNPQAPISISGDARLTVGGSGIDLSASTQPMFIGDAASLANVQQMWVTGSQALLFGSFTRGSSSLINMDTSGGGSIQIQGVAASADLPTHFALNSSHRAALDGSNNVIVATYADYSLGGNLSGTYTGILNVAGTAAGSTQAWRQSNAFTVGSGVRFGANNTQNTKWTVDTSSSGRVLTTPSILVGSDVSQNIEFNNSGGIRAGSSTGELIVNQFGSGELIFNAPINGWNGGNNALIKGGGGKVVLAGAGGYIGPTRILAGTFQLGNNGTTGSLSSGAIQNDGSLIFARSNAVSIANVISGTGTVTQAGAGELTLSGANTYTGLTNANAGYILFSSLGNFGSNPTINLNGGGLRWATGTTTDISARTLNLTAGTSTLDTNGNNVTLASAIGNGGAGGLGKAGAGTLTLAAANTYTGGTTVSGGVLNVANTTGSGTGTGGVSVVNGGTLAGTGVMSGVVSVATGGVVAPAESAVGTLTAGGLSLGSGSVLNYNVSSVSSYDRIITTDTNGLVVNGGGVNLYNAGGTTPLSVAGTYNLIQFAGGVQGAGATALSVLNPQAGYSYTFGTSGNNLTLLVELEAILSQWSASGSGSWGTLSNWSNGIPISGYTAQFTTSLPAPSTVTLDGSRTVNGMVFSSANGYTIISGTDGSLTFDKGVKNVDVNVALGDHIIGSPVVLASSLHVAAEANASLSLNGVVSGSGGISKTGNGTLNLNAHNTFAGNVSVTAGTLGFAHQDSLGAGQLSIDNATLKYGAGNTADISDRAINVGINGVTVDTNGNDVIWLSPFGNGSTGTFTKAGAGILSLASATTRSGNTILKGGILQIDANDRLGSPTSQLIFDGGTLATVGDMTLATVGETTVTRPIVVNPTNGTVSVPVSTTFTLNNEITGTGTLAKDGAGTLNLLGVGNVGRAGGLKLLNGTVRFNSTEAINTTAFIGTGQIVLEGGSVSSATGANNTFGVANAIDVPSAKTATWTMPNRFALSGAMTGAGTLNLIVGSTVTRSDLSNNWAGFTGTLNLSGSGGVRLLNNGGGFNVSGMAATALNAGQGLTLVVATNTNGNTVQIGSLSGGATLTNSNGGISTWQIGARNESTTFSGSFVAGQSLNSVSKVGTGSLTLNGPALHAGLTTVTAGTLLIDSVLPASTVAAPALPARAVTVAVGGTLGGVGTITPDTVVNGRLSPDATGLKGGKLTFGGVLELLSTATTQFDFSGASYTGLASTSVTPSSVTYGGALKFNFLGTVFNGTYQVFELAAAPAGAFTGATVTTTADAETALTDVGAGVFEGTVGLQTYSFNSATGVLTVSGSAAGSPVTPAAATLTANPGDGVVGLTWSAASGADTYLVKRSTTTGTGYVTLAAAATGTSYNDTTVTNGVTYYYVVQGRNTASSLVGPNSNEATATPAAAPSHTDLQNWRFDQFGVYDDDGTVLAGDNEDFDGDGLVNLMEYALGTNPTVANASPITVAKVGNVLTLTYPRRSPADPALAYSVLGSNDLVSGFTAGAGATETVGSTSTYTDTADLSAAGSRRFLRLSVTYTAP